MLPHGYEGQGPEHSGACVERFLGRLTRVRRRLQRLMGDRHLTSIKRYESASPASGSSKAHVLEQQALLKLAFA